jgi:hypothetical protein
MQENAPEETEAWIVSFWLEANDTFPWTANLQGVDAAAE